MKALSVILPAAVLAFSALGAGAQEFQAGAAFRVVTPNPLLPVSGGVGEPQPVDKQLGDLFARALVMEQGGTRVAIVGVDFLGWPSVLGDRARQRIKSVPADNVMIGSTHTHSAPDPYGFPDMKGNHGADLEYLDWVCTMIAEAVDEAASKLEPADARIAVDEAKGKIAYNYYAPKLYDPRMGVIQAVAEDDGAVICTLVNYATHPEVLGNEQGILSPDLCGPMYERIEEKAGGVALFMNSAQGGMVTADNRIGESSEDMRTWEECLRIGQLMAEEALRIAGEAEVEDDPALFVKQETVTFPIDSKLMRYILKKSPLNYGVTDVSEIPTRVHLVNLGDAQILTIPGEALPNIGFYVKRHMPTKKPFLFGLTNDAFGYMLAKVDFNSFERYNYVSQTSL
ncbi:MAG: hypothetical protein IT368_06715, partial [Candidatus Hydrogenedentes bacterium]|nr:hypothetical protein [Candidatus Hydrogenedentota bacterium]